MKIFASVLMFLSVIIPLEAQFYFLPLKYLYGISSTFGDMRRRHLHYGVDFRTGETIGKPVYASEKGYISRIFVADYGYGKALYIKHPDGNTTVYAHLDRFAPEIEKFVYQKQVQNKRFKLNTYLTKDKFPVEKGQLIAYSGNTGGSSGPHLHYEVRDKKENITQPLRYLNLQDNLSPYFSRIAIQPLNANSRVNGKFAKKVIFPNKYSGEIIYVKGNFGVEITAYDKFPKSKPYLGIYSAKLFLDDSLIFAFAMNKFSFWQADYIPASIDFKFYQKSDGIYLRKLYIDNKNLLPIYIHKKNNGIINLIDNKIHRIMIVISDFGGNSATFKMKVQNPGNKVIAYDKIPDNPPPIAVPIGRFTGYDLEKKHLIIKTLGEVSSITLHFTNSTSEVVRNYYQEGTTKYFIWKYDIDCVPAFATLRTEEYTDTLKFNFVGYALPNEEKTFVLDSVTKVYISPKSLVDTVLLEFRKDSQGNIFVHNIYEPVIKPITICVKPPEDNRKYVLVEIEPGGKKDYVDNHYYSKGYCCAPAKQFGKYILIKDENPPEIRALNLHKYSVLDRSKDCLYFSVKDLSEIKSRSVQAYADGKWVLTEFYDYQKIIRIPLRYLPVNTKKITIKVSDNAGNRAEKSFYVK